LYACATPHHRHTLTNTSICFLRTSAFWLHQKRLGYIGGDTKGSWYRTTAPAEQSALSGQLSSQHHHLYNYHWAYFCNSAFWSKTPHSVSLAGTAQLENIRRRRRHFVRQGNFAGLLLYHHTRRRSLLAYLCAGRPGLNSIIGEADGIFGLQRVYLGHSFAFLGGCSFSFLSLVVITDTHSCNLFFVYWKSKWEIGFHLTSTFSVSYQVSVSHQFLLCS